MRNIFLLALLIPFFVIYTQVVLFLLACLIKFIMSHQEEAAGWLKDILANTWKGPKS